MPALTLSDWLGLAGIILSLLGFGIAWVQLKKTKNAAESASVSAREAREAIRRLDALLEFNSLSKSIDEMINAFRSESFETLASTVGNARKSLIVAREAHASLPRLHIEKIDAALSFLTDIEVKLGKDPNETFASGRQKIIRKLVDISNTVTAILANPNTKDPPNG